MPMVFSGVLVTKLLDEDEIFDIRYLSFLWLVQMTCIASNWCFIFASRSTYNVSCLYPCYIHSCYCCFTIWLVSVFARQLDFLGNFQTKEKLGCFFFFIEICSTMLYVFLTKVFFLKDAATMHPISSEALKNTFWMHSWGTYFIIVAVQYILPSPIASLGAALDLKTRYNHENHYNLYFKKDECYIIRLNQTLFVTPMVY